MIIKRLRKYEEKYSKQLKKVHPKNYQSALNLVHYIALRSEDIRPIQIKLGELGLSRLGRAERHVLANVFAIQHTLKSLVGKSSQPLHKAEVSIKKGKRLLSRNTRALLGVKRKGSHTRIMVTLPSHAGDDKYLVSSLVKAGMSIARVNCSHDSVVEWESMANRVRKASKRSGKAVKIAMDLGGPKLRTGSLQPGPQVVRLRPKRDLRGRVVAEPLVWISTRDNPKNPATEYVFVPVDQTFLKQITSRSVIDFRDTRDKKMQAENS